jgi:hypothetical protein
MRTEEEGSELEKLRRENEMLRAKLSTGTRMKVSAKGALSVYGLGRFPVTLYKGQWLKLLDMTPEIREFIKEHLNELSDKEDGKLGNSRG